ncbi:MAG: cytochrome d ubiquinol oxidase subunit II [Mailhella sp.]|nr:cytochrome d ubiquinol oxidase subunit II [Mailhella sp.]
MDTIWFFLWTLLWAVYFILDGFDLGMGTLMPALSKSDMDRRVIFNAQGPFWDGNEVWLITAGGVTFAAFPNAYAVLFSALYAPLLILLFCLIFRAVALEFRNKIQNPVWKWVCDLGLFLGSFAPALLLGVAFANLFMGIPIDQNGVYHGNLFMLLNPYGLAGGVLFVLMFCYHGALWLELKSEGELQARALTAARILWPLLLAAVLTFLSLSGVYTDMYTRIAQHPVVWSALTIAVVGLLATRLALMNSTLGAFIGSAVFILGLTFFGVFGMYPGIILSSIDPAYSITVFNGASSALTLKIMLGVTLCAVPIVLVYQAWVFWTFRHKVTEEAILNDHHAY